MFFLLFPCVSGLARSTLYPSYIRVLGLHIRGAWLDIVPFVPLDIPPLLLHLTEAISYCLMYICVERELVILSSPVQALGYSGPFE
jgi:hypothetical protein